MPNIPCIFGNGAVSAENTGLGDVHKGHLIPHMGLGIEFSDLQLCIPVRVKVCKDHIGVMVNKGIKDFCKLFPAETALDLIQSPVDNPIVFINIFGIVT